MSYAKFKTLGEKEDFPNAPKQPNQSNQPSQSNTQPSKTTIKISSLDHKNAVIAGNKICLVDVYTDWCGPCQVMAPRFDELNRKYGTPGHCVLVKENAEDGFNPSVTGVPTFDFYFQGKQVGRLTGVGIDEVETKLLELLAK